jgi:hypothetical protein
MPSVSKADTDSSKSSYLPQIHGTIRARYEFEPENAMSRFQVSNARVSVSGNVGPKVDYRLQADFCATGSFKMLDAWAGLQPASWLRVQAGQQLVPFSVAAIRSPHLLYFANRALNSKLVSSARSVGVTCKAYLPGSTAYIEPGVFNTYSMTDHSKWNRSVACAAKVGYQLQNVKAEFSMESVIPDSVRANALDVYLSWASGRWMVESEYTNKHYVNDAFRTSHAYNVVADYHMPLHKGMFNRLSFQGRFDGMTDYSNGRRNASGYLYCSDHARNRVTVGSTVSYIHSAVKADLRLNYEKYFYHSGFSAPEGDRDKIALELVVRF